MKIKVGTYCTKCYNKKDTRLTIPIRIASNLSSISSTLSPTNSCKRSITFSMASFAAVLSSPATPDSTYCLRKSIIFWQLLSSNEDIPLCCSQAARPLLTISWITEIKLFMTAIPPRPNAREPPLLIVCLPPEAFTRFLTEV